MVWAGGTQTITPVMGSDLLAKVTTTNFDADAEQATTFTLQDLHEAGGTQKLPVRRVSIYSQTTNAGAVVDVVSLKCFASVDNVNFDELAEITDADISNGGTSSEESDVITASAFPTLDYLYFYFIAPTVGLANVNTIIGVFGFGEP